MDIEKAIIKLEIKEGDRGVFRFLWFDDINRPDPKVIQVL